MNKINITEKVNYILTNGFYNKVNLCKELGISRPTLDRRLLKQDWRKLEIKWIIKLVKKIKT